MIELAILNPWPGIQIFLITVLAFGGVGEFIAYCSNGFSIKKRLMSGIGICTAGLVSFGLFTGFGA